LGRGKEAVLEHMLSIIIPTLDEENYLPILLQSIKNQSFKDYEIIIALYPNQLPIREYDILASGEFSFLLPK